MKGKNKRDGGMKGGGVEQYVKVLSALGLVVTEEWADPHHGNTADCVQTIAAYQRSIHMEAHG